MGAGAKVWDTLSFSSLLSFIDFLKSKGSGRALQHSVLTAQSGRPMKAHAGGQIPYAQYNFETHQESVRWKEYGWTLNIHPETDRFRHIRLQISARLEEPAASIEADKAPAVKSRRIETALHVRDGAIIRLFQIRKKNRARALKGGFLGGIPLIRGFGGKQNFDSFQILFLRPEVMRHFVFQTPRFQSGGKRSKSRKEGRGWSMTHAAVKTDCSGSSGAVDNRIAHAALKKEFSSVFENFRSAFEKESFAAGEGWKRERVEDIIEKSRSSQKRRFLEELTGYGPLEPLLKDPYITEIIINDQNNIVFEKSGTLNIWKDSFLSPLTFQNIVERICMEAHLTVNLKKPFAEGRWKSFRMHIIRPPLVRRDFHVIFRRHPQNTWTLDRLLEEGWGPSSATDILKDFLDKKYNFLIVGPTNCGKTSLLNACLQQLPFNERVVTIEDTDEILIPNSASAKLLTQTAPESSAALVDQEALVKQSLRLRPRSYCDGGGARGGGQRSAFSAGQRPQRQPWNFAWGKSQTGALEDGDFDSDRGASMAERHHPKAYFFKPSRGGCVGKAGRSKAS